MATRGPLFPIFDWQRTLLNSELPKETKLIGWALSTYTNKQGANAHPGETRLALALGVTTKTVRNHLKRLRADGFIGRTAQGSIAEHRNWADVYELTFPEQTTGSGFPVVPGSRDPFADAASTDHRKFSARPPETERPDHRKLASAQQPMASTHLNKASESPDSASLASERGDEDAYNDPWTTDEERFDIIVDMLGGYIGPGDEPAIQSMIERRQPPAYIVNVITSGRADPAA